VIAAAGVFEQRAVNLLALGVFERAILESRPDLVELLGVGKLIARNTRRVVKLLFSFSGTRIRSLLRALL
jgi:hypothetical protein